MADEFQDFLTNYPAEMQVISQALRVLIKTQMPAAQEVLYASQNHIGYSLTGSQANTIVYICPMQKYVRFGFMRGSILPDPEHLMEGKGKWLRHIKIRQMDQVNQPALVALIQAASEDATLQKK